MSNAPFVQLSEFLRSAPGCYVLAWEQRQFDTAVADIFGYHALQLGLPEIDALRENRMPLRFCASERLLESSLVAGGHKQVAVVNRFEELPFETQSIDLVVMPHVLEFAQEPHQVLREVERVLVPEGHVVISGFNPASLWGLRQYLSRLGMAPFLPRAGQFISLGRAKDWLKLLSFEANRGRFGCYAPWARSERWLARWSFIEKAGDRWWPVLGSVYMVTAIKRVRGMRLVGPAWKRKEAPRPAFAPAATRTITPTGDAYSVRVKRARDADNDAMPGAAQG
jgi:SAM-dependent methyltransferase